MEEKFLKKRSGGFILESPVSIESNMASFLEGDNRGLIMIEIRAVVHNTPLVDVCWWVCYLFVGKGGEYVCLLKIDVIAWIGIHVKMEIVKVDDMNSHRQQFYL